MPAAHHQSYPYVLANEDGAFMVPESSAAGRVELWRSTDFPTSWELVAPLLDGIRAADPSIYRYGGLYWMWVNQAVPGSRIDEKPGRVQSQP